MQINVPIDKELVKEAQTLGGFPTEVDTVEEILRGYVQQQKVPMAKPTQAGKKGGLDLSKFSFRESRKLTESATGRLSDAVIEERREEL